MTDVIYTWIWSQMKLQASAYSIKTRDVSVIYQNQPPQPAKIWMWMFHHFNSLFHGSKNPSFSAYFPNHLVSGDYQTTLISVAVSALGHPRHTKIQLDA